MGDDLLEIKWEDSTKRVNYLLEYKGQQLYKGKFIYEKDNVKNIIFDGLFNLETEEVISGQVMQFFNSTRVKYSGKIKNGEFDGQGILYRDSKKNEEVFIGQWSDGEKVNGKLVESNLSFEGEFRNDKPYSGVIKITSINRCIDNAYQFEGKIENGKPLEGRGYTIIRNTYSPEYQARDPLSTLSEEALQAYYESQNEEIPEEVQREWYEDDIRNDYERKLSSYSESCDEVVELVETEWHEGIAKQKPEDYLFMDCYGVNY